MAQAHPLLTSTVHVQSFKLPFAAAFGSLVVLVSPEAGLQSRVPARPASGVTLKTTAHVTGRASLVITDSVEEG